MLLNQTFPRLTGPTAALAVGVLTLLPVPTALAAPTGPGPQAEATQAAAGTQGSLLLYTAAPGQANRVTVSVRPGESTDTEYYYVYSIDDVYDISAGPDCVHPDETDPTKVVCTLQVYDTPSPYTTMKARLGDRNDGLRFLNPSKQAYYNNEFWLGDGNDTAYTRQSDGGIDGSGVWGQNGDDHLTTGSVGDNGGAHGGNGDDLIQVYGSSWGSGGNGDDQLYGYGRTPVLRGDDGNDQIHGTPGRDSLYGGKGNDRIWGRPGADSLYGNSGNDRLYGGPGNDTLLGGPGKDVIKHN